MALTKHQVPAIYTPAFNEQVVVYTSNQTAISDFKYVVSVSVVGTITKSWTFNVPKRPDGLLVFDVKDIVSNVIKTQIDFSLLKQISAHDVTEVTIEVVEFYSGSLQGSDSYVYNAFNACLKEKDFRNYVSTDFFKPLLANYTDNNVFVNDSFNAINIDNYVTKNTDYWLTFVRGIATNITWVLYDETNTSLGSGTITLPSGLDTDLLRINLSPKQIAVLAGVPVENEYTIEAALNSGATSLVDIFVPKINEICTNYDVFRLYFLKRNGAISYKTFERSHEIKVDKKINSVEFNPSVVTLSGGVYSYGKTSDMHSIGVVSTETTYTYTLNTDWITEAQSILLEELFDSPKVWLQSDSDGSIIAVSSKDLSYARKKHIDEPLFNYTVNIVLNQTETRQRGI